MQISHDLWQSSCGQDRFIHENSLLIGYLAWQGFMQWGPGLMACDLDVAVMDYPSNRRLLAPFATQFIAEAGGAEYLQQKGIEADAIAHIQSTIRQYNPQRELILVLIAHHQLEILLLQNLAITPPDCHRQVCNRWEEFMTTNMLIDSSERLSIRYPESPCK